MYCNNKTRVASWRLCIHIGVSYCSVFVSEPHDIVHFILFPYVCLCYICDINSFLFIFMNLEIILNRVHQISNFFHIDFNHTDFYRKFNFLRRAAYLLKDMFDHSWDYTPLFRIINYSRHCVRFAWACLTISKYSAVKAFHYTLDDWLQCFLEHIDLLCVYIEHAIIWVLDFAISSLRCDTLCVKVMMFV